jgi:excisionase family DNA binding protein
MSPTDLPDPLLDVRAVAELLNVRERWVYERAQAGDLPSFLIGRYRRFRFSEVEAWLRKQRGADSSARRTS